MNEQACVEFLQWCLPEMKYQWKGFRRVRSQVCKRIKRRLSELNISDFPAYRTYLEKHNEEWKVLDSLCYITISRLYRDRSVMEMLRFEILPQLAKIAIKRNRKELRCWCAGCCCGEEPYTLQILWQLCILPDLGTELPLQIVATDRETFLLQRAKKGCYPWSALKRLPQDLVEQAFIRHDDSYEIKNTFKNNIEFIQQDIRKQFPEGEFDIIFCRNLAFTYFQEELQLDILKKILEKLKPGGFLVIGAHESLPGEYDILVSYDRHRMIYQKKRVGSESCRD